MSQKLPEPSAPFQFHSPTTISIYAPPYSGKSTLTRKILEHVNELFTTRPEFIVYCYNDVLPELDKMKETVPVELIKHKGVPSPEDMEEWAQGQHFILVLDDLQEQVHHDKKAVEMFTVGSHHKNYTLIYLCHNIFGKGAFARTISVNTHYMILFRNNRDILQVQTLARQMYGKKSKYFMDAYAKATSKQWGYLVVNIHPTITDKEPYRLLTGIIPGEETIIYRPRDS